MVSPARRREAVLHLVEKYRTSQRQACRALSQPRSTQRRSPRPVAAPEELLRLRLREISTKWPRWGFRRAHATLRLEGWKVNHKRVQRLWRDEGLRVPQQSPKRRRLGQSTVPADRLRAERPNQVWALDFMFDTTSDGRPFTVLSMCDEFTKECLEGPLARSITADAVVAALTKAASVRGFPEHVRCDNGRSSSRKRSRTRVGRLAPKPPSLTPARPGRTPTSKASTAGRDELFAREIFDSILEAKVLYADWCHAYNVHRPHSALSYQPPAVFAKAMSQSHPLLRLDQLPGSAHLPRRSSQVGIQSPAPPRFAAAVTSPACSATSPRTSDRTAPALERRSRPVAVEFAGTLRSCFSRAVAGTLPSISEVVAPSAHLVADAP